MSETPALPANWAGQAIRHWPLVAGLLVIGVPTLIALGREAWTLEIGAHGPIVLATGAWLLARAVARVPADARAGHWAVTAALLAIALPAYIFGRAFDFISLEAAGVWATGLAASWALIGPAIRLIAFPFIYLAFLIPPPGWLVDQMTAPLQQFVSFAATQALALLGYPILRNGVTIFIAQYQLLVEQACSGMNSIVGLTAISLFYIYMLYGATWRYSLVLVAAILPVAVATNIVRVIALVLITYYMGDAAAQGFLHVTTGVILFAISLTLMVGLDAVLRRALAGSRWGPAA